MNNKTFNHQAQSDVLCYAKCKLKLTTLWKTPSCLNHFTFGLWVKFDEFGKSSQ